jgi:hypothetical protein
VSTVANASHAMKLLTWYIANLSAASFANLMPIFSQGQQISKIVVALVTA